LKGEEDSNFPPFEEKIIVTLPLRGRLRVGVGY